MKKDYGNHRVQRFHYFDCFTQVARPPLHFPGRKKSPPHKMVQNGNIVRLNRQPARRVSEGSEVWGTKVTTLLSYFTPKPPPLPPLHRLFLRSALAKLRRRCNATSITFNEKRGRGSGRGEWGSRKVSKKCGALPRAPALHVQIRTPLLYAALHCFRQRGWRGERTKSRPEPPPPSPRGRRRLKGPYEYQQTLITSINFRSVARRGEVWPRFCFEV